MAPVIASETGVQCQRIDDLKLREYIKRLASYGKQYRTIEEDDHDEDLKAQTDGEKVEFTDVSKSNDDDGGNKLKLKKVDIEGLVGELERCPQWRFQEQADLYEWIDPLNAIDAALTQLLVNHPDLLLIKPKSSETNKQQEHPTSTPTPPTVPSQNSVPQSILHATTTILKFLIQLLKNCTNKILFNSLSQISQLLAAADDTIASLAIQCCAALATLPLVARQQSPDIIQHSTAFANSSSSNHEGEMSVHKKLMLLAKGWGSRGSDLGLVDCVTADDSVEGQGKLPAYVGEVRFEFIPKGSSVSKVIELKTQDIITSNRSSSSSSRSDDRIVIEKQQEKRLKLTTSNGPACQSTKSTAALFSQAMAQLQFNTENPVELTEEQSFALLTHIRLAASFHSQATRMSAIERRLHALLTVLYAHPTQEILVGYFEAQPELCGELVDLVRPTVSPTSVSSCSGGVKGITSGLGNVEAGTDEKRKQSAIDAIVDTSSSGIPYHIRSLAIEVLTAVVARNENANSTLSQLTKQSNVLAELGVIKGQFLGLLPTLMRYSLASLNTFLSPGTVSEENSVVDGQEAKTDSGVENMDVDEEADSKPASLATTSGPIGLQKAGSDSDSDLGLELGLTFLEASKPPPLPRQEQEEKALEFIDLVLALTSAVVNIPSGTTALTDCGLVPALVSTITLDSHLVQTSGGVSPFTKGDNNECDSMMEESETYADAMLQYIIAHTIQILESALTTHNAALAAFYDLNGANLLVNRLHVEIQRTRGEAAEKTDGDEEMKDGTSVEEDDTNLRPLKAAKRALLFSVLNCLAVVFHRQESSSRSIPSSALSSGMQLRKPEMTNALADIMEHVWSYGGVLAALASNLLSHIMNSDPQVVHYVHEKGLAKSFFNMIRGTTVPGESWFQPNFPPSPDLIMAIPNVVSALALTEDGMKKVQEANPVREMLGILCSPEFSMPQSRCLLGDMASVIGSGLYEIMRHHPSMKKMIINTVVDSLKVVVDFGKSVFEREKGNPATLKAQSELEDARTQFIHYAHNIGQVIEQVLQNEEHFSSFVDVGGVERLLNLFPLLMPNGKQLLAHVSCHSSPSVASLTHSTTANVLFATVKRVADIDEPQKVIKKVVGCLKSQLDDIEQTIVGLRNCSGSEKIPLYVEGGELEQAMNVSGILEAIPSVAMNLLDKDSSKDDLFCFLAMFLNRILSIEWLSDVLQAVMKVVAGRGRFESIWKEETLYQEFEAVLKRLATLHLSSIHEVCRIRSSSNFEERDLDRFKPPGDSSSHPALFRLRVVCAEGAVLRDGIEIDSCANVGGLEMGEVVIARNRCINRCGIMRYRTDKGWISEQTRGHSREPIVEVLSFSGVSKCRSKEKVSKEINASDKTFNCGIFDLCSASASVLSRLQNSQTNLYSSIGKSILAGFRSTYHGGSHLDFKKGSAALNVSSLVRNLSQTLCTNFSVISLDFSAESPLNEAGASMYFGNMLSMLHTCLYEDKRDRQTLNVLLLCNMLIHEGTDTLFVNKENVDKKVEASKDPESKEIPSPTGFLSALRFVIKFGLSNMAVMRKENVSNPSKEKVKSSYRKQRLNRSVASSFPSAISLLSRLISKNLSVDPSMKTFLVKLKSNDLKRFLIKRNIQGCDDNQDISYQNVLFASVVNSSISGVVLELWTNPDLIYAPAYIINPVTALLTDTLVSLEVCCEENDESERRRTSASRSLAADPGTFFSRRQFAPASNRESSTNETSDSGESKSKSTEASLDDSFDNQALSVVRESLKSIQERLVDTVLNIIEGPGCDVEAKSYCINDDEVEVVTIVMCSFLQKLCERNSIERLEMINQLILRMKACMHANGKGSQCTIIDGAELKFACLCHAAVILLRALPRARPLLLKNNLVSCLAQCIRSLTSKTRQRQNLELQKWPRWLSSALLLLDVMAQPTGISLENQEKEKSEGVSEMNTSGRRGEYARVCSEHKRQRANLAKVSKRISSALSSKAGNNKKNKSKDKESKTFVNSEEVEKKSPPSEDGTNENTSGNSGKEQTEAIKSLSKIPTFLPLMTQDMSEFCLSICLQILKCQQKCLAQNDVGDASMQHLPSVTHASLVLLTRILRSHKCAVQCLKMGGAELLLSLGHKSRFQGHVGLLTVALRRMLEDETNLQTAMETELRITLTKLQKRQARSSSDPSRVKIETGPFIRAVTPLICRDPSIFLKAAATSIKFKSPVNKEPKTVVLLSSEERASNSKKLAECFRNGVNSNIGTSVQGNTGNGGKNNPSLAQKRGRQLQKTKNANVGKQLKSKSPHRQGSFKHGQSPKATGKSRQEKTFSLNGSPANHITSLLLNELLKATKAEKSKTVEDKRMLPFLCIVEYLEMIADLVLAIPACAGAIHRYQPQGSKDSIPSQELHSMCHAVPGCSKPPRNIVSYLLHKLLPQPRPTFSSEDEKSFLRTQFYESSNLESMEKKESFMKLKISQSTARLLVVLVARAGEGRRRVISDLSIALSGQRSKVLPGKNECNDADLQMWALQAWGELCIGLAAPRSSGVSQDSNTSLSFEVVRVMMECGMTQALLKAINIVKLDHPNAATVAAALLRPLEVFSRPSVVETLNEMIEKEEKKAKAAEKKQHDGKTSEKRGGRPSLGASQQSESAFADDAMLGDGFDADTAERNVRRHVRRLGYDQMLDDDDEVSSSTDNSSDEESDSEEEDELSDDDMEEGDFDTETDDDEIHDEDDGLGSEYSEADNNDGNDDENVSSSSESERSSEMNVEDDNVSVEDEAVEMQVDNIEDDLVEWDGEENDDFFEGHGDVEEEEAANAEMEAEIEEGWTRIDTGPVSRLVIGGRNAISAASIPRTRGTGNNFTLEAAEAVIGNFLRGSIEDDAIAEIEETLGMSIINRGDPSEHPRIRRRMPNENIAAANRGRPSPNNINNARNQNGGPVGTVPTVDQLDPPDNGYSSVNVGNRVSSDINYMEYLYGGPPIGSDRMHYNLVTSGNEQQDANQMLSIPLTLDTELFPGGPAASTHSRTLQILHQLLNGVTLPPINALVSLTTRPRDDSGSGRNDPAHDFVGRNLIQLSSRGVSLATTFERPPTANPPRDSSNWTDDGQPLDDTATEFSLAFEQTLGSTVEGNPSQSEPEIASDGGNNNRLRIFNTTSQTSTRSQDNSTANAEANAETNGEDIPSNSQGTDGAGTNEASENQDENTNATINNASIPNFFARASQAVDTSTSGISGNPTSVVTDVHEPSAAELAAHRSNDNAANEDNATNEMSDIHDETTTSTSNGTNAPSVSVEISQANDTSTDQRINNQISIMNNFLAAAARTSQVQNDDSEPTSDTPMETEATEPFRAEATEEGTGEGEGEDQGVIENASAPEPETNAATAETGNTSEENPPTSGVGSAEAANEQQNSNGLVCPPGMDLEVFNQLPIEMQLEIIEQHQSTSNVAEQLDSSSSLDPEVLAALPEDMRREIIEQEQNERRLREAEQAPADPSHAEDMDTVSFLATLGPGVREQVLLDLGNSSDLDSMSLPPDIRAEIELLRERSSTNRNRRSHEEAAAAGNIAVASGSNQPPSRGRNSLFNDAHRSSSHKKRAKPGRMKVDSDRKTVIYTTESLEAEFGPVVTVDSMRALLSLMYLLSPVRPQRLLHKLLQNLCGNGDIRRCFVTAFIGLLNDKPEVARRAINLFPGESKEDSFPPSNLLGITPDVVETEPIENGMIFPMRRNVASSAAAIAANFPVSAKGSFNQESLSPIVARRLIGTLTYLSKHIGKISLDLLNNFDDQESTMEDVSMEAGEDVKCLDTLIGLLRQRLYARSSSNLDDLLNMIESVCFPMSLLPFDGKSTKRDLDSAASAGKEWVEVPRTVVSTENLQLLCSTLRLESCKGAAFTKINTIAKRLCRVEANRDCIRKELAVVAQDLGADGIRDLKSLGIRLNEAVKLHQLHVVGNQSGTDVSKASATGQVGSTKTNSLLGGTSSSAVTLSTSSSELKLLHVLQSLQSLCVEPSDDGHKKSDGPIINSKDFAQLLSTINLEPLWEQLTSCLRIVSVLEGVTDFNDIDEKKEDPDANADDLNESEDQATNGGKKLQNSVAGLLIRFLPTIEAFFVVNASAAAREESGDKRLLDFVAENKVLLNALLRSNPSLLEKGLRAMVQVPRCRPFLDFDIKRQWFKTQVRRLRQHANRRHGSLRLNIRREHVFYDAYHRLHMRNADEMRGRLQITFANEEGVDGGGLSREFFGILAKEMFNPNYALFTSTEDGCTFQPNPHSNINHEHLNYFKFVGRVVGKAVVDGFLLDAHFTRSLYKHMLGVKPTHHDMQAIDPDYYKNLKMILEYNLEDIGLDLTFSTEAHSFGRSHTIDLIENGRNVKVTEENKEEYVSLVCQYRMTTAIEDQIKSFLSGFHELVKPELISIFTAKELELLISGMPDIDIHDLKKNTDYQGYKAADKEIVWFWNIMFSLSRSEKAAFLQFVTGSSKVPLAGFAELQGMRGIQKFSIHKARGSNAALMSAHTCFNALDLPVYKSELEMKEKLLYAIQEGGGSFLFA